MHLRPRAIKTGNCPCKQQMLMCRDNLTVSINMPWEGSYNVLNLGHLNYTIIKHNLCIIYTENQNSCTTLFFFFYFFIQSTILISISNLKRCSKFNSVDRWVIMPNFWGKIVKLQFLGKKIIDENFQ